MGFFTAGTITFFCQLFLSAKDCKKDGSHLPAAMSDESRPTVKLGSCSSSSNDNERSSDKRACRWHEVLQQLRCSAKLSLTQ